jgi:hypothetical protein
METAVLGTPVDQVRAVAVDAQGMALHGVLAPRCGARAALLSRRSLGHLPTRYSGTGQSRGVRGIVLARRAPAQLATSRARSSAWNSTEDLLLRARVLAVFTGAAAAATQVLQTARPKGDLADAAPAWRLIATLVGT